MRQTGRLTVEPCRCQTVYRLYTVSLFSAVSLIVFAVSCKMPGEELYKVIYRVIFWRIGLFFFGKRTTKGMLNRTQQTCSTK